MGRISACLLAGALLGGLLAPGGAARAQVSVGQVVEETLPTEQGYSIPLPQARWRVTQVSVRRDFGNPVRVVALRNEAPSPLMPYLFIRYSTEGRSWTLNCAQGQSGAFAVDAFGTLPNQLVNKCARSFATTLPGTDPWWSGLEGGIDAADAALRGRPFLLTDLSLVRHQGHFVRVEAFVDSAAKGLQPRALRDADLAGQRHLWTSSVEQWSRKYMRALDQAVLSKQRPAPLAALEGPDESALEDQIRQMAGGAQAVRADARPAASVPAKDERELVERIRQMSINTTDRGAGDVAPSPVIAQANARPSAPPPAPASPAPAPPAAAPPAAVQAPVVPATAAAVPPPSAELARLSAEVERLRAALETRPTSAVASTAAPAAPAPGVSRRLALVIGNDAYVSVSRLQNARADARAMAEVLGRTGYQVRLRLDLGERAMKDELRAFKAEIRGGDEVLFYFAGHGVQLSGANYLLPTDVRGEAEDQVRDDAVLLQKVLDDIQDSKARFALAIIDACRDNPFRSAGRSLGGRGLAPTAVATGQMVMFSAGAGQQALDRLGERDRDPNGLFTRILLKEIDKPDVSVDRVLRAVRNQVVALARTVGHEQVPALYDQSVGEFYFRR